MDFVPLAGAAFTAPDAVLRGRAVEAVAIGRRCLCGLAGVAPSEEQARATSARAGEIVLCTRFHCKTAFGWRGLAHVEFNGVGNQFLVTLCLADCSQKIQRTKLRDQIQMPGGAEMRSIRLQTTFGLKAEDRLQRLQRAQQTLDIGRVARMDHIDIKGIC